jgi:signal transduction histidine kinase
LLEAFAVSAGTAVATARSLAAERTQQRLNAAEEERKRWARELHDETLQSLAILRLTLSSAREQDELDAYQQAAGAALEQIDAGIQTLRALITELRPVALDELGPRAALEALAVRSSRLGLDVHLQVALDYEDGRSPARHVPELEVAVYRIVQEAIQNAAKHSRCSSVDVRVSEDAALVEIVVRDDGVGFDLRQETSGYGLLGMRERAELLDGTVEITSVPGAGTTLHARLPVRRR